MRVILTLLTLAGLPFVAYSAEPPSASFDIRVNLADQRQVHLALTVPARTSHRLQVDGDLVLELRPWGPDGRWVDATVISTEGGADRRLGGLQPPYPGTEVLALAFSVCGDRIIALSEATPGRCADLPPMAKADRALANCGGYCSGPYEGMPAIITSHERIAPPSEPGEPLTVSGRVLGHDGRPRSGIIVYGYQTDRMGIYPAAVPPRGSFSNYHGRLRGWARTDAQGRYVFDTIRPGSYGGNPQHIHLHVIEPDCSTYRIDDLMFASDPLLERLTPEQRQHVTPGVGGSGVGVLRRKGKGWEVARDIHLGQKVPGYEPCAAPK